MKENQDITHLRKLKSVKFSDEEHVLMLRAYIAHPSKWSEIIEDVKANVHQLNERTKQLYETSTNKQLRDRISSKLNVLIGKSQQGRIENLEIRALIGQICAMERSLIDRQPPQPSCVQPGQMHTGSSHPVKRPPVALPRCDQSCGTGRSRTTDVSRDGQQRGAWNEELPREGPSRNVEQASDRRDRTSNDSSRSRSATNRDLRDQAVAELPPSSDDDGAGAQQQEPHNVRSRKRKTPLAELVRDNHTRYNRFMRVKMPKILRELGISSDESD